MADVGAEDRVDRAPNGIGLPNATAFIRSSASQPK
jgi:hypothetical protein